MPLARGLEAELLDQLPADDPRAMRSRGDLARVNAVMMQAGITARTIRRELPPHAASLTSALATAR